MKATLAIVMLATISLIGVASAATYKMSEIWDHPVYVYNEKLYIINDDNLPHTVTHVNGTFDTTILGPGKLTDVEIYQDGDYQVYDKTNPANTGIIHVRKAESPVTRMLTMPAQVQAGDTVTIIGTHYPQKQQPSIKVFRPDGTLLDTLSAFATSDGKLEIPLNTVRTSQNGIYAVQDEVTGLSTSFVVSGGVTEDLPTVPAPVTNSTGTNSTTTNPDIPAPSTGGTTTPTPTAPTDKQALINWLKQMIAYYQQLLAIVEAS